jgi:hypothetical protein
MRRPHTLMCAVGTAAGGQQHLGLTQIKSRRTGNQEQHPAHQQVGNETLHLCSLEHLGVAVSEFAQPDGKQSTLQPKLRRLQGAHSGQLH